MSGSQEMASSDSILFALCSENNQSTCKSTRSCPRKNLFLLLGQ